MGRIIVTGASGQLGRQVVDDLLQEVDATDLLLVTRSPDALADRAEQGMTVRHGDFDQPDGLVEAFAGGERMLLISTDVVGNRVQQHRAAVAAATEAGVALVAYTSILNPSPTNPAAVVDEHAATEEAMRTSGMDWVMLRNSIYADLQAGEYARAADSGMLVTNDGPGRVPYVTRRDCAAAAAAVLAGEGHAGHAYDITGPDLLDADDRATLFAELAGRPVEVLHLDDEAYAAGMAEATGMPLEVARTYTTFGTATRAGCFAIESDDFTTLTGRPAQELRTVLT